MQDTPYEDIINLPHHVSRRRPQMPMRNRAAQFAPFAALSGYGEAIDETARTTDAPRDLLEDEAEELNLRLQSIAATLHTHPLITIEYFVPDTRKAGGQYRRVCGRVASLDATMGLLCLDNGPLSPLDAIVGITLP